MRGVGVFLFLTPAMAGCASTAHLSSPTTDLDKAIYYEEITTKGDSYYVSGSSTQVFGVPNGTEIDTNSRIKVEIKKEVVRLPQGAISPEDQAAFLAKAAKLRDALEKLAGVIESRSKTLAAFAETEGIALDMMAASQPYKNYRTARKASNQIEHAFNQLPIWRDGTIGLSEEEIDKKFEDPTYKAVGFLLQQQLDSLIATYQEAEDKAKRTSPKLTMYAYLKPAKGENAAIHLANYDTIDQREATFKSSFLMDQQDWQAFQEQYKETRGLADQAEQVRKGESSLRETITKLGLARLEKLAAAAAQIEPLLREDWPSTRDKLGKELAFAEKTVGDVAASHGRGGVAVYSDAFAKARDVLTTAPSTAELKNLLVEVKSLRDSWQMVSPDSLVATIEKTRAFAIDAPQILAKASKVGDVQAALLAVVKPLENRPQELALDAWNDLQTRFADPAAMGKTKSIIVAAKALKTFTDEINSQLDFTSVSPSATDLKGSQVIEVAWADAPNTEVEITKTPRAIDDDVHVVAKLKLGDKDFMQSHAIFSIQKFGWHADLSPSVILAKPIRTSVSFDKEFKFAPAAAWLHTYSPRDTEGGFWNAAARFSQLGFGLHAAFLDFDPQKEVEIGLGGAISLWHGRLLAGAGWNLMNNTRPYLYIGSDLIPILQSLGYGKQGGAGKQP